MACHRTRALSRVYLCRPGGTPGAGIVVSMQWQDRYLSRVLKQLSALRYTHVTLRDTPFEVYFPQVTHDEETGFGVLCCLACFLLHDDDVVSSQTL